MWLDWVADFGEVSVEKVSGWVSEEEEEEVEEPVDWLVDSIHWTVMRKLRWVMDGGGFWDLDISTPQTLDGLACAVPGDPLPLGLSRGTRLSRPRQLEFMHRFMNAPLIPSYAKPHGLSLHRLISLPFSDNWYANSILHQSFNLFCISPLFVSGRVRFFFLSVFNILHFCCFLDYMVLLLSKWLINSVIVFISLTIGCVNYCLCGV